MAGEPEGRAQRPRKEKRARRWHVLLLSLLCCASVTPGEDSVPSPPDTPQPALSDRAIRKKVEEGNARRKQQSKPWYSRLFRKSKATRRTKKMTGRTNKQTDETTQQGKAWYSSLFWKSKATPRYERMTDETDIGTDQRKQQGKAWYSRLFRKPKSASPVTKMTESKTDQLTGKTEQNSKASNSSNNPSDKTDKKNTVKQTNKLAQRQGETNGSVVQRPWRVEARNWFPTITLYVLRGGPFQMIPSWAWPQLSTGLPARLTNRFKLTTRLTNRFKLTTRLTNRLTLTTKQTRPTNRLTLKKTENIAVPHTPESKRTTNNIKIAKCIVALLDKALEEVLTENVNTVQITTETNGTLCRPPLKPNDNTRPPSFKEPFPRCIEAMAGKKPSKKDLECCQIGDEGMTEEKAAKKTSKHQAIRTTLKDLTHLLLTCAMLLFTWLFTISIGTVKVPTHINGSSCDAE
ncbi:uncharacterized protein LOC134446834 [Engraulis encrasicolus]|uniref:uncharacterized protein LOC134446834 n=1 Tax=Engraulis encrasicolus TaxID=184585 RepID=UPI002FD24B2A